MVTWYEVFLFVHISAAVIWVGGGFFLQILALRVMGTRDEARMAAFAGDAEVLGMRSSRRRRCCCSSPASASS